MMKFQEFCKSERKDVRLRATTLSAYRNNDSQYASCCSFLVNISGSALYRKT